MTIIKLMLLLLSVVKIEATCARITELKRKEGVHEHLFYGPPGHRHGATNSKF